MGDAVPPTTTPAAAGTLAGAIAKALTSATRAARLTTLELRGPGMPELATLVRRDPARTGDELALWVTAVEAGSWHGGLVLVATAPDAEPHRRTVVTDAAAVVDELVVADRRRLQAELLANRAIDLAGLDALTQLGNRRTWRRALDEESARAVRYDAETTIAVLDLDGLKRINDSQGHAAGDRHLLKAADAVKAASRSVDIVCRLGGDEFAVLAPETGREGAGRLATRLLEAMTSAGVAASIGVATRSDGDLDRAWQEADSEMYAQKRQRSLVQLP